MRERLRQGAGQPNLNTDLVKGAQMPMPPRQEQQRIISFLDENLERISAAEELVRKAIDLLGEYRSSLITAAVTGKLDMREHEEKIEVFA
jgi:type I restriction enzyme S subunit